MRKWIYEALYEIKWNKTYSNLYLKNNLKKCPEKDRNLATRIVYGTIQNYMFCEYVWLQYVHRKVPKRVQSILTMSVYQLLFLDKVPAYAVVNEAVDLTGSLQPSMKGLVNAVLHKIKKENIHWPEDEMDRLSITYSCPKWLLMMWKSQYGYRSMIQMSKASLEILAVTVRRNPMRISMEELIDSKQFEPLDPFLFIYKGQDIAASPFYKKGQISVQDKGSYEICRWMDAKPGDKILDCCAAPGTKSMAMAEQMEDQGNITCLDLYPHRVKLIQSDQKRLHLRCVTAKVQDATDLSSYGIYDKVLCDVPCSGYGVMARKPDIKLHMQPTDMDSLIPVQYQILQEASKHVKENGILIYSTCTLNKKENEKQIERFLKENKAFTCIEQRTLIPNEFMDGFFIAKMQYIKSLI